MLSDREKMGIERTGYFIEAITFGQPDEKPGVLVHLKDPSGSIIDRVVVTAPVGEGRVPSLSVYQNSGAKDTPFFKE